MKRINIQKDVDSRAKIATSHKQTIVEPIKVEVTDAKRCDETHRQISYDINEITDAESQEIQRAEINPTGEKPKDTSHKRVRATKRDTEKVQI